MTTNQRFRNSLLVATIAWSTLAFAAPQVHPIGAGLYSYISDNDSSSNSTFLVGEKGILVVDTGFDATEGGKLLRAIRAVSPLPVLYIVNTHYHRDHQAGNSTVGPTATVISTGFTRQRTIEVAGKMPDSDRGLFHPAEITLEDHLTIFLDPYTVEVYFPGKAHTSGDALVYFPQQQALATGDLFLNRCSPAMDQGSAENWIRALDEALQEPLRAVVPGHFELGSKADLQRFRDYLSDLYQQVQALVRTGADVQKVRARIHMEKYADFRQYPKFEATFADNAETIFHQIKDH
jgi:cyclase